VLHFQPENATFSLLGPNFLCWNQKKWEILGHFGGEMEKFGHFRSKMVDFGLLACLEKQLPLKITLIGGYREKALVELNNIGTFLLLLHFGPFPAFPPHKQACAKQYNHTKEK
jgi:hypothetical protein